MRSDSDIVLLGTGVAPLVAAARLIAAGRRVVVLNPDADFFSEDSELPLDPLTASDIARDPAGAARRLSRSSPERALEQLRPDFPGAIELWPQESRAGGAGGQWRDLSAPHVHARSRLWLRTARAEDWASFEEFYLASLDAGMKAQMSDGISAVRRFPGVSARGSLGSDEEARGLWIPRLADVDVNRYRYGLLEFVSERLGSDGLLCGATQIEFIPDGIRFYLGGQPRTIQIRESALVFWTPRLIPWVLLQAKRFELQGVVHSGVRLWEQWILRSRDLLDPSVVGVFEDMIVWGEIEGAASEAGTDLLSVLRPGGWVPSGSWTPGALSPPIASSDSIRAVSRLCSEFLKWNGFSVRAHRSRMVFDGGSDQKSCPAGWVFSEACPRVEVLGGADGPLVDVVERAREAAGGLV